MFLKKYFLLCQLVYKLVVYPLQAISINFSFCLLFETFLANDMFGTLPLLFESVNDGQIIAKDPHKVIFFFKQVHLQIEPAMLVCQDHELYY